ncbi:MAG: 23S rRNA (pseudouridine(1915)-N(3))-methyltransferase RlmH [Magnetospiraceae bacterium]
MRFTLVAVGRSRDGPERDLFAHFNRRLQPSIDLREVDEKRPLPPAQLIEREGALLLGAVPEGAYVIVLDEKGKTLTSQAFATRLEAWQMDGIRDVAFLIGGANGHGAAVKSRANLLLSLGGMTWPHMLVRGLVAEQVYRAHCILTGHPYHRD